MRRGASYRPPVEDPMAGKSRNTIHSSTRLSLVKKSNAVSTISAHTTTVRRTDATSQLKS
jgi:hypothetical protein